MFRQEYKLKPKKRSYRTHWVVACLLVTILLGITGIPVPVSKSTSERFPCEKCPCGCVSAAHCWDKCCCHSDKEKLAWAEANHVEPPKFLVERVTAIRQSHKPVAAGTKPACCAKKSLQVTRAEAKHEHACRSCDSKPVKPDATKTLRPVSQFKLVLADPFQECHGLGKLWKLLQSSYIAPKPFLGVEPVEGLTEQRPIIDAFAFGPVAPPDGPVPRDN